MNNNRTVFTVPKGTLISDDLLKVVGRSLTFDEYSVLLSRRDEFCANLKFNSYAEELLAKKLFEKGYLSSFIKEHEESYATNG